METLSWAVMGRPRRGRRVAALRLIAVLTIPLLVAPGIRAQGGAISGAVSDPDGLPPPAGTVVRLLKANLRTFGQTTVDAGDGSFEFGLVPNGNYILRAEPPEDSDFTSSEPLAVSVLGAPVDVGAILLTNPSILGTVFAPDSVTPTRASIHVHRGGRWVQTVPAMDGEVKIGGLPAGTYSLQAWPMDDEPYWSSERLAVDVDPSTVQKVSLTLTQASVFGTAVDTLGQPVKDAIARVIDGRGDVVGRDLTGAGGHFAIGGLRDSRYRLTLEPPWWRAGLKVPDPVPFTYPPQQNLGTIAFGASRKVVTGRVETNTSVAVVGALVEARRLDRAGRMEAISGADGRYAISLSEGLWSLTIKPLETTVPANWAYLEGPQLVHFKHDISQERKTIDFRVLLADSRVIGAVEMPSGSVPAFSVTVGLHSDTGVGRSQEIDPDDGTFDIRVPHGAYRVSVRPADDEHLGPPVDPIRVMPNSAYDLGTLGLLKRDATLSGAVTEGGVSPGDPVSDVPVVAWRRHAPGRASTRTGPDGTYVLAVAEGTWLVRPAPEPDQPWLYAGLPQEIDVSGGGHVIDVNFTLTASDAEISGILVDEQGTPITDVGGWAHARSTADPKIHNGAPLEDGTFTVLVPAGTYKVSLKLPAGTPWLAAPAKDVVATAGETTDITLTLRAKNAVIAGALWDRRAEEVVTGVKAHVLGWNEGAWVRTAVDPGNGAYRLEVAPGIWALGYNVDPTTDYVALRHRKNYPVASGQTVPAPLPVAKKDSQISGIVRDPSGEPLAGATVVADGLGLQLGDLHLRVTSGDDGRFRLRLPHGHYLVRATLGAENDWINPASLNVYAPKGGDVARLKLQFVQTDATITGSVTLARDGGHTGKVRLWAYSPHDGFTKAEAELGGRYSLNVTANTTWYIGAAYQDGPSFWATRARVEVAGGVTTKDLQLGGPYPLPAPLTVSFDSNEGQYVELSDGTSIHIPAGAMPVNGTVTLQITPIGTFPHQRHANVYRYGYAFTAADEYGQPIEQQFNQDVLITFRYDDAELLRTGIAEQRLKPAYFSTTTDSWTFPQSYVVDTTRNVVAMQTDHLTDFALTGAAGHQVLLPLVLQPSK